VKMRGGLGTNNRVEVAGIGSPRIRKGKVGKGAKEDKQGNSGKGNNQRTDEKRQGVDGIKDLEKRPREIVTSISGGRKKEKQSELKKMSPYALKSKEAREENVRNLRHRKKRRKKTTHP